MRHAAVWLMLFLTSCGQDPAGKPQGSATSGDALEQAALKAGAIHSGSSVDPAGLFAGDHGSGGESLCLRHSGDAYRFDLRLAYGERQSCKGSGIARRAGEALVFAFTPRDGEGRCILVADYDGDRLVFPGAVDKACERLCTGRSTVAGVGFVRTDGVCGE